MLKFCFDILLLNVFTDIKASLAGTGITFLADVVTAVLFFLVLVETFRSTDGQVSIGNRSLDLILGKSRKINHQLISILLLFDIGLHNPSGFLTVKLLFGIIHFFIHIIKWKLIKPVIK